MDVANANARRGQKLLARAPISADASAQEVIPAFGPPHGPIVTQRNRNAGPRLSATSIPAEAAREDSVDHRRDRGRRDRAVRLASAGGKPTIGDPGVSGRP